MERIPVISTVTSYVTSAITFLISLLAGGTLPVTLVSAGPTSQPARLLAAMSLADIGVVVSMAGVIMTFVFTSLIQWYWKRREYRDEQAVKRAQIRAAEAAEAAEKVRLARYAGSELVPMPWPDLNSAEDEA